MSGALYSLGRFCIRRRLLVAVAWLALLVAFVAFANAVGKQTSNNLTLPGTGSTDAQNLLNDNLPKRGERHQPGGHGGATRHPRRRRKREGCQGNREVAEAGAARDQRGQPAEQPGSEPAQQGQDRSATSRSPSTKAPPTSPRTRRTTSSTRSSRPEAAGLKVATGGYLGQAVSKPEVEQSELVGLAAAVVILLFTFGTVSAMALPIATAIVGLAIGLSAIGLLGHGIEVPTVGPTLGTMLGLGVGIDYALFIVTRHRGFIEQGHPPDEAAARAVATAGGAVVFAGGTVVIALCSLAVARIPIVSALGYSAAVVVLIAVITATTLLPALLSMLGETDQRPAGPVPAPACPRSPTARLGALGARRGQAPGCGDAARRRDPAGSCDPGAEPAARSAGQRPAAEVDHPTGRRTTCSPRASARGSTARC